jgi:hypothetical protein
MIMNFNVLDHIVMNDELLTQVEEHLKSVGQDHLADILNKLQQDAGVKFFNELGNGKDSDEPCDNDIDRHRNFLGADALPTATALADNFEELPPQRLQIFNLVRDHLPGPDEGLGAAYNGFLEKLTNLAEPEPVVSMGIRYVGPDFSP